jgi:hypothetical protein
MSAGLLAVVSDGVSGTVAEADGAFGFSPISDVFTARLLLQAEIVRHKARETTRVKIFFTLRMLLFLRVNIGHPYDFINSGFVPPPD